MEEDAAVHLRECASALVEVRFALEAAADAIERGEPMRVGPVLSAVRLACREIDATAESVERSRVVARTHLRLVTSE